MDTSTVLLGLVVCIVVVMLILQLVYVVVPLASTGRSPATAATTRGSDVQHVAGFNRAGDPFLYDGTYYVFRVGDVQLSSPTTLLKYSTMLTDGYLALNTSTQTKYSLSRAGIKMVYHDNTTLYVVVPVSYTHDWLNRGYIAIKDDTYVLAVDAQVVATSPIPAGPGMRTPLALPVSPTLPQVCRN